MAFSLRTDMPDLSIPDSILRPTSRVPAEYFRMEVNNNY